MNLQANKRIIFIIAGIVDSIIAGAILLIYFGLLPVDISGLGIPRWVIGVVGGLWFIVSIGILVYQLTKPNIQ